MKRTGTNAAAPCPPTGCGGCRFCQPEPGNVKESPTGMVCALSAPVLFCVLAPEDLNGYGPLNCQGGKPCTDYQPRED